MFDYFKMTKFDEHSDKVKILFEEKNIKMIKSRVKGIYFIKAIS